jgi:DNA-binding transcriptional ArsR family regulator
MGKISMATNKKFEFKGEELKISEIAKAFSHPARVAIIKLLAENGPTNVNNIVDVLPLSQSTVSQHIKELKAAGMIKGKTDGPRVYYSICLPQLQLAKVYFDHFFSTVFHLQQENYELEPKV